jgi:hypothetical protein
MGGQSVVGGNPVVEVDIDLDGDISVEFEDGQRGYVVMPEDPQGGESCLLVLLPDWSPPPR